MTFIAYNVISKVCLSAWKYQIAWEPWQLVLEVTMSRMLSLWGRWRLVISIFHLLNWAICHQNLLLNLRWELRSTVVHVMWHNKCTVCIPCAAVTLLYVYIFTVICILCIMAFCNAFTASYIMIKIQHLYSAFDMNMCKLCFTESIHKCPRRRWCSQFQRLW